MNKRQLKATIFLLFAFGMFIFVVLNVYFTLHTKDILYRFPLDLERADKTYNFEYTHPFYSEEYVIYLRLKKLNKLPSEMYDKKIEWKININLKNDSINLFNSTVDKNNMLGAGYGTNNIDFALVKYTHKLFAPQYYGLQVKALILDGLSNFMEPEIIISYFPKCGLEGFRWAFTILIAIGLGIILLLRGIRCLNL